MQVKLDAHASTPEDHKKDLEMCIDTLSERGESDRLFETWNTDGDLNNKDTRNGRTQWIYGQQCIRVFFRLNFINTTQ